MHTDKGHRQRVKDRFRTEGLDGFEDVHALELLLFYALPQKDTKPMARELLNRIGSFNAVLDAPAEELKRVPGVGESVATYLSLLGQLERYRSILREKDIRIMNDLKDYGNYLKAKLSNRRNETVYLMCLDAKKKMLSCNFVGEGDVNSANIPMRRMVELALAANASSVILAHNHPSGFAVPSQEDIMTTNVLAKALMPLGIVLADHVVVADEEYISMRASRMYIPEAL